MYSVIYLIRNLKNGKCYIGKTKGKAINRITRHLNGHTPGCRGIHKAIKKHGRENFVVEILESNVFPEMLSDLERFYVAKFDSFHNGYNLTEGGETGHQSEETIRKRTEKLRANPPMKGKKQTPEARAKMSESRTGSKRPPETRQRMSESAMGHPVSEETKQKISKANQLPEKRDAHKLFDALPVEMPLREKVKILSSTYPNVKQKTINYWMSEWCPHKTKNQIRKRAYADYQSLPASMDISEKRKILKEKYSKDVDPKTVNRWIRQWQSEI